MLRFRLGRIPVEVHFSHVAFAAICAFSFIPHPQAGNAQGWPDQFLVQPGSREYLQTLLLYVVAWMGIIFTSVLIHELGHAVVSLAFGYKPRIQLIWMGGNTQPQADGPIPWLRDVALTAAGPLFGFGLALVSFTALKAGNPSRPFWSYLFTQLFAANILWAMINLLPVSPMDGGRIVYAVTTRFFGKRGFLITQIVAVLTAGAAVAVAAYYQQLVMCVFFGMWTVRSLSLIASYIRGEAPLASVKVSSPLLDQATAALRDGDWTLAKRNAEELLLQDPPRSIESRTQHVLGWVALKEGQGRRALEHFSQMGRQGVEPQALAAAFSLIGDEERAEKLWNKAYQATPDRTLVHEWAGTLIRQGKSQEASRLPGVDLATAYACAEAVYDQRGLLAEAARVAEEAHSHLASAKSAYQVACLLSRAGQYDKAIEFLKKAQQLGLGNTRQAAADPDLFPLLSRADFKEWIKSDTGMTISR